MHLSTEFLEAARMQTAPHGLAEKILQVRARRRITRRLLATSVAGALMAVAMLMAPRHAYADLQAVIAGSVEQPIVQVTYWREIRGRQTERQTTVYHGPRVSVRSSGYTMIDDGKVREEYFKSSSRVFVDDSTRVTRFSSSLKDFLDKRWKWASDESTYNGTPAIKFSGHGTFRDRGSEVSMDTVLFSDRARNRILYSEQHRGSESGDFWEYAYPKSVGTLFDLGAPAGTPVINLRKVRSDLIAKAATVKTGLVAVIRDFHGMAIVITRGGAAPDARRPKALKIGDWSFMGMTYAFGVDRSALYLPKLGRDAYFQSGIATIDSQEKLSAWNRAEFESSVDVTYSTWRSQGGESVPDREVSLKASVITVPSLIDFLGRLRASRKVEGNR